jgi:hypothetical protein
VYASAPEAVAGGGAVAMSTPASCAGFVVSPTGQLTVQTTGIYAVDAMVMIETSAVCAGSPNNPSSFQGEVVSSSGVSGNTFTCASPGTNNFMPCSGTFLLPLTAGDTVTLENVGAASYCVGGGATGDITASLEIYLLD